MYVSSNDVCLLNAKVSFFLATFPPFSYGLQTAGYFGNLKHNLRCFLLVLVLLSLASTTW